VPQLRELPRLVRHGPIRSRSSSSCRRLWLRVSLLRSIGGAGSLVAQPAPQRRRSECALQFHREIAGGGFGFRIDTRLDFQHTRVALLEASGNLDRGWAFYRHLYGVHRRRLEIRAREQFVGRLGRAGSNRHLQKGW